MTRQPPRTKRQPLPERGLHDRGFRAIMFLMDIRYFSFPTTAPPPPFIEPTIACFHSALPRISSIEREKGLVSDKVLDAIRPALMQIGFDVEQGKKAAQKIKRPVFFGEGGRPKVLYEIDAYHPQWKCGLEVEAGRAWMGNAVYRDLVLAMLMVNVDHLMIAVPITYKYTVKGKPGVSRDYDSAVKLVDALFSHERVALPYGVTVIGY